jgi:hypothetical protein
MVRIVRVLVPVFALCLASCSSNAAPPPAAQIAEAAPVAPAAAGSKASGQGYQVEVTAPPAAAGKEAVARVTLKAVGGYHVNKEFPYNLKIAAPEGVTLVKAQQGPDDAAKLEELEAAWDVKFTAASAGDKAFTANFRFAVCTETTCDPKVEKLAWNVTVK